jgi:hypothetical protein
LANQLCTRTYEKLFFQSKKDLKQNMLFIIETLSFDHELKNKQLDAKHFIGLIANLHLALIKEKMNLLTIIRNTVMT